MARRTKRNRRKKGNGIELHAPMIAVLALAGTVFISYLWLCGRCEDIGNQIKNLEVEYDKLHVRYLTEDMQWNQMITPGIIRFYLRKHNLDMDLPDKEHIVRISFRDRMAFEPDAPVQPYEFAQSDEEGLLHD